jgi:outer membrane lipoprotein-sorting protein
VRLLGLIAFALVATTAAAAAPDRVLLDRIDASAKQTHTLSAEFTQKNRMKLFRKELQQKGRLLFQQAPRQIRWEYTAPDPSVLLLNGQAATLSAPGSEAQVFDLDKDATLRAVFDQLLTFVGGGSIATAQANYALEAEGDGKRPRVVLVPHAESAVAKAFARIELSFDEQAQVRAIKLIEKNGDEKEITFTKVERNRALPTDAFKP